MSVLSQEKITATDIDIAQASDLVTKIETQSGALALTNSRSRSTDELPAEISRLLVQVLSAVARGGSVTIGVLPAELTTTTAAEVIGVSRPTLMKMIRNGEIPSHQVGSHHRLNREDVEAARDARRAKEREAFRDLLALEGR